MGWPVLIATPDGSRYHTDLSELAGVGRFDADPGLIDALDNLCRVVELLVTRQPFKEQSALLAPLLLPENLILVEPAK